MHTRRMERGNMMLPVQPCFSISLSSSWGKHNRDSSSGYLVLWPRNVMKSVSPSSAVLLSPRSVFGGFGTPRSESPQGIASGRCRVSQTFLDGDSSLHSLIPSVRRSPVLVVLA